MQPALRQKLNHLTDHLINVFETVCQPTHIKQLPVISTTYRSQGPLEILWGVGVGVRGSQNRINRTCTIDFSETNLKYLSDFCQFFFILITKVATNKKSTSTKEYEIKYFFNTFIISLMSSFYKETSKLSVINTKKSLCSGVPQSPR